MVALSAALCLTEAAPGVQVDDYMKKEEPGWQCQDRMNCTFSVFMREMEADVRHPATSHPVNPCPCPGCPACGLDTKWRIRRANLLSCLHHPAVDDHWHVGPAAA